VTRLRILALEPYYGGSHRAVLDGLVAGVDADWTLLTLPARKWKWRMRGAAMTMAAESARLAMAAGSPQEATGRPFDVIFASTFLNLAEYRGMVGSWLSSVPAVVYFHENQLVYPNRHTAEWDFQFPLTNITTALSAEACVFNTVWNLEAFLEAIPGFLREFPDHHPVGVAETIREKSCVIAPPFDPAVFEECPVTRGSTARIVWPHRWEHDKNPDAFFSAVARLAEEGLEFEVVVAGQSFRDVPESILAAERTLGSRLVHLGQPETRSDYAALLSSSDVAVSTAVNEFFGLAMVEASYAGCMPLVPDRLAYRELYPSRFRYRNVDELTSMLRERVVSRPAPLQARALAERFTFERLVPEYARRFAEVAERGPR
jgi:glycosyltransferase involved in cell wall biosynthesis